jgi:hypothetical protein
MSAVLRIVKPAFKPELRLYVGLVNLAAVVLLLFGASHIN